MEQFTGKERDAESGLDYFGARYYGSALGRFTSADWSAKPTPVPFATLSDPQSLNLYSYVRNKPLSKADADGHCTPPKLKDGQVGVCIDTYIQAPVVPSNAPAIGLGDNRGPAANDPKATYRQEIQMVISPGSKPSLVKNDAGTSVAIAPPFLPLSSKGTSTTTVSDPTTTSDGTEHFNVSSSGLNGFASVPFAPKDTIKTSLNFSVTQDGKVGLDPGGMRTAYPSIEIYAYGSDGSTRTIYTKSESGNLGDLKSASQPVPAVNPQ